jgi:hypothetical protein
MVRKVVSMSEKQKKTRRVQRASDGVITPQHIADAQKDVMQFGLPKMYATLQVLEPELAAFMAAVAEHISAQIMFHCGVPHGAAMHLRQEILALAVNVYRAQHSAVYEFYKDIIRDTPVAVLDRKPFPVLPAEGEEGGSCAKAK